MKRRITKRYGGTTEDGRKLVVYDTGRVRATNRLRDAGVVGKVRRLAGRCVDGVLEMPAQLTRGPEVDNLGKRT